MIKIDNALREFGLSENEIKIYKASLILGLSPVSEISKRAGTYRTLTYEIISKLSSKGLIGEVVIGKKKHFRATPPQKLLNLLREKEAILRDAMPELIKLGGLDVKKPHIVLYEGIKGVRTALGNTLSAKEIKVLASKKAYVTVLDYFAYNYIKRREEKKVKLKLITDEKPISSNYVSYKILKKKYESSYWIYNNKLLFINFVKEQPLAVLIENKEIAGTIELMFEQLWNFL